jgi:hypothetical protein
MAISASVRVGAFPKVSFIGPMFSFMCGNDCSKWRECEVPTASHSEPRGYFILELSHNPDFPAGNAMTLPIVEWSQCPLGDTVHRTHQCQSRIQMPRTHDRFPRPCISAPSASEKPMYTSFPPSAACCHHCRHASVVISAIFYRHRTRRGIAQSLTRGT